MATLKDQLLIDAELLVSDDDDLHPFAQDVTYDPDDTAKVIRAIVDLHVDVDLGDIVGVESVIFIRSDAAKGIASPVTGDFVTVEAIKRRVVQVITDEFGFHELQLVKAV